MCVAPEYCFLFGKAQRLWLSCMPTFIHSTTSVVHLLAVLLALVAGTAVVASRKGTRLHRHLGRVYVGSMCVVLLTAFRIYVLFGRFGIVHWGAVGSVAALLIGTGAVVLRPGNSAWLRWHYLGMGASVTGLYAALIVESTYRFFPPAYFWWSTLGPTAAIFLAGGLLLRRYFPGQAA